MQTGADAIGRINNDRMLVSDELAAILVEETAWDCEHRFRPIHLDRITDRLVLGGEELKNHLPGIFRRYFKDDNYRVDDLPEPNQEDYSYYNEKKGRGARDGTARPEREYSIGIAGEGDAGVYRLYECEHNPKDDARATGQTGEQAGDGSPDVGAGQGKIKEIDGTT